MMIIQVVFWVLFMYGFLSLVQDIVTEFTYKKYNKNIKVFVCIKDYENQIENFVREICRVKWQFKNIGINVVNIDKKLSDNMVDTYFASTNIAVCSKEEFFDFANKCNSREDSIK